MSVKTRGPGFFGTARQWKMRRIDIAAFSGTVVGKSCLRHFAHHYLRERLRSEVHFCGMDEVGREYMMIQKRWNQGDARRSWKKVFKRSSERVSRKGHPGRTPGKDIGRTPFQERRESSALSPSLKEKEFVKPFPGSPYSLDQIRELERYTDSCKEIKIKWALQFSSQTSACATMNRSRTLLLESYSAVTCLAHLNQG